jgi:hypothetical protein
VSRPARAAKEAENNEISEKVWTLGWRRATEQIIKTLVFKPRSTR